MAFCPATPQDKPLIRLMKMKRYEPVASSLVEGDAYCVPNDAGDYVLHTEAAQQIESLRTALEEVMAWSFGTGTAEQCGAKCSTRTEAEEMARAALQSAKEEQA